MGQAKNEMMRLDDLRSVARDLLVEAGAASECPHGEVLLTGDDDAEKRAYAIGTNMFKAGKIEGTREEFMEAIQGAIEDASGECPSCRKIGDE
jgi:hypothetical protein